MSVPACTSFTLLKTVPSDPSKTTLRAPLSVTTAPVALTPIFSLNAAVAKVLSEEVATPKTSVFAAVTL